MNIKRLVKTALRFFYCLACTCIMACSDTNNSASNVALPNVVIPNLLRTPEVDIQKIDAQVDRANKPILIIDTDMAIDDWVAILYLLNSPDINVPLISVTGAGESYCIEGMRNALYLIRLAGRESEGITVACGDSDPMDGFNVFPQPWRDDVNSFYGLGVPDDLPEPSTKHAVEVLVTLITEQSEPVSIVALGNVTNIAQLLQTYSSVESGIDRLYLMGGAIEAPGNIIVPGFTDNNKNRVSEWNFYVDPLAAKIVINANITKVLVPLDATNQVQVTHQFAAEFKQRAISDSALFIDRIFDRNKEFISSGEYYFWDPLTAVYALHPEICQARDLSLDVIYKPMDLQDGEGNARGSYSIYRTDGSKRQDLNPTDAGRTVVAENGAVVSVCLTPNAEQFKKLLIDGLNKEYQKHHE